MRRFIAHRSRIGLLAAILVASASSCTTPLDPASDVPAPGDAFVDHFVSAGERVGSRLVAGAEATLPDGATLALPRHGPGGLQLGISRGSLTQKATDAFEDGFPDVTINGPILQVTVRAEGDTPDYVILHWPVSDGSSRVFVAGYLDADTGELAWEPVDTRYDAGTGLATALIGWEQLGPVQMAAGATEKQAGADASPSVYTGHVAIGVGGQPFQGEYVFMPQAPAGPLTVPLGEPPLAGGGGTTAVGRIGLRLTGITHAPLDSLVVTSGFGPRARPARGATTNHGGVDYRAEVGTFVYAAGDGVVITSRCDRSSVECGTNAEGGITAGYFVEIDHGNGEVSRYLHLSEPAIVTPGQRVIGGQPIAFTGDSGGVNPHLHFAVSKNGVPVNPELIFNRQLTATMAMAIDHHIQPDTREQIPITFGEITPETMSQYHSEVELAGLSQGRHRLQFVLIEPRRRLRVLAEVPVTVARGVLTGRETHVQDIVTSLSDDKLDQVNDRKEFTFTLTAAADGTLEGHGRVTYSLDRWSSRPGSGCPDTTGSAAVEWGVVLLGFYTREQDGSISVYFFSTPSSGPRFLFTQNSPGCPEKTFTQELSGEVSPSLSATIINGRYYVREDVQLAGNETGEFFHEVSMQWRE